MKRNGKSKTSLDANADRTATVLLSGGIDSSACIAFFQELKFKTNAVFVDYGQVSASREAKASKAVATHYSIPYAQIIGRGLRKKGAGMIWARNAFLLTLALMELHGSPGIVAVGIHSGTRYQDCTPAFVRKIQALYDTYTGGCVKIAAPFLLWRKADIWAFCKARDVPLQLTYSCELGRQPPCGICDSCRDLEELRARESE